MGRDFVIFFISALHFWIKQYINFLNLTKFVSQHLIATPGHFHRHQFLTANYFFIRPVLSYLAVATATWQHWFLPSVCLVPAGISCHSCFNLCSLFFLKRLSTYILLDFKVTKWAVSILTHVICIGSNYDICCFSCTFSHIFCTCSHPQLL